jgi:hypothetical protein
MAKSFGTRRDELLAWLATNGLASHRFPLDADMTIQDGPDGLTLRCEVYDLTADGYKQLDERAQVARTFVTVPLKAEPPAWWEPYEKPTRDDLMAAAERVHALHRRNENTGECEYCSARDYPDYQVAWPCDTVQALMPVSR